MNVNASVLPYREESLCFGPESRLIATLTLPGDHPDSALPAALTGSAELPPPHPHLHQASRTSAHPAAAGRAPQRRPPGLILLNAGMLLLGGAMLALGRASARTGSTSNWRAPPPPRESLPSASTFPAWATAASPAAASRTTSRPAPPSKTP